MKKIRRDLPSMGFGGGLFLLTAIGLLLHLKRRKK